MPKYKCQNCGAVWYGWANKGICQKCGGRLKKVYSGNKRKLAKGNPGKKEFEKMCGKAGIKKEALCETIFTKNIRKW